MVGIGGGEGGPPRWTNGAESAPITPGVVLTMLAFVALVIALVYVLFFL